MSLLQNTPAIAPTGTNGIYGVVHFKNIAVGIVPLDEQGYTYLVGQYRYALAFENIYHPLWSRGYVDKITDCLMCGTVPIYLGGYDIEKRVPPECFIDFRKFGDYKALDDYLHHISDAEYASYIENINEWVTAGNLQAYSLHRVLETVAALVDPSVAKDELATVPWERGLAEQHREGQDDVACCQLDPAGTLRRIFHINCQTCGGRGPYGRSCKT